MSLHPRLRDLLPTFLAGANFVMHAAGWLEGGLVNCWKFIVDVELLRMLAFGAHAEVGHGGHFLGTADTTEREYFYRPPQPFSIPARHLWQGHLLDGPRFSVPPF